MGGTLGDNWAVSGVSEPTRAAVAAAAIEANMTLGAWIEQALQQALAEEAQAGVPLPDIEARVRRVVADELAPVHQALARIEAVATQGSRIS